MEFGKDERGYLPVDILGISILGLLDSGSGKTVAGFEGFKVLHASGLKMHPSKYSHLRAANKGTCQIMGEFFVPFEVGGIVRVVPVLYAPGLSSGLILGMDFWKRFHLRPDFVTATVEIGGATCEIIDPPAGLNEEILDDKQKKELEKLLDEFRPRLEPGKLGTIKGVAHTINIGDAKPFKATYYSVNPKVMADVHAELERRLENDIVEPADSPFQSPLLIIPKKTKGLRWVVDFRKLNSLIQVPDSSYPLPRINPMITKLGGATILSTIDISDAYLQVLLSPESKPYTAFYVPGRGQFQFKRMPAGLKDAASRWQKTIEQILADVIKDDPHCMVYMDDIVLWSPEGNWNHHLQLLKKIFTALEKAGVTVNLSKSQFAKKQVKYLGHIIDSSGVRPDPAKIASVVNFPVPSKVTQIRQFLGLAGWMRRFIPHFSSTARPLYSRFEKNAPFIWGPEEDGAFVKLKEALCKHPVLRNPDFARPFKIYTDASILGTGGILTQDFDDGEHVIAYTSRTLKGKERNFSATELECLGVLHGLEAFRPYIDGYRFELITDHSSLLWLHKLKNPTGRLARWAVQIQQYDMKITHRKGSCMQAPDALSRNPIQEEPEVGLVDLPAQIQDDWYLKLMQRVREEPDLYEKFKIHEGQLYKLIAVDPHLPLRWVQIVPREVRRALLYECHDEPTSGHGGWLRTFKRIRSKGYWPGMQQDVKKYVRECQACQRVKVDRRKPPGFMSSKVVVSQPMEYLSADLIGPLPRSKKGFNFISVVTDTFSKYTFIKPLRKATAPAVCDHLETDVILKHGAPRLLQVDNGTQYTSRQFKDLCAHYRIKLRYNVPYTPRNNPTERMNQTLETLICSYVQEDHRNWDQHLPALQAALNTSHSAVTGLSPHEVLFGEALVLDGRERLFDGEEEDPEVVEPKREEMDFKLEDKHELYTSLQEKINNAKRLNAHRYNLRRRRGEDFHTGDLVWRRNYVKSKKAEGISKKLAPKWIGPFAIRARVGKVTYLLEDSKGKEEGPWHIEQIKRHFGRTSG